jgi:Mrp family chromosome partitioning ATPase
VVIDAPPFLGLPDAARFLQAADSVVIVVRRRAARLYQVQRLIDRLNVLGAKPVGTVLNMSAPRDEDLAYGYPEAPGAAREPVPATQPPKTGLLRRARGTTQLGRGRPEDEDSIDEESLDGDEPQRPAPAGDNGRAGDPKRPEPRR